MTHLVFLDAWGGAMHTTATGTHLRSLGLGTTHNWMGVQHPGQGRITKATAGTLDAPGGRADGTRPGLYI